MTYTKKDYSKLLGAKGFSDKLLDNHFKLYQGYVDNTNKTLDKLKNLEAGSVEWSEIKRRFGWEFNGMRLHELYFENICNNQDNKNKKACNGKLKEAIEKNFGSFENFLKDFTASGKIRGIGWVILYYDQGQDRLFDTWINEHDLGHLSGAVPLLVMDVFEHAYIMDYGLNRSDYIKTFMDVINWDEVQRRFKAAQ